MLSLHNLRFGSLFQTKLITTYNYVKNKEKKKAEKIYQVYTAPDFVNATENCDPHSTLMTPRLCKDSTLMGTLQPSLPPRP